MDQKSRGTRLENRFQIFSSVRRFRPRRGTQVYTVLISFATFLGARVRDWSVLENQFPAPPPSSIWPNQPWCHDWRLGSSTTWQHQSCRQMPLARRDNREGRRGRLSSIEMSRFSWITPPVSTTIMVGRRRRTWISRPESESTPVCKHLISLLATRNLRRAGVLLFRSGTFCATFVTW